MANILPLALGAVGLLQNGKAQKQQGDYIKAGISSQKPTTAAQQALLKLALDYNPHAEDQRAIASADANSSALLKQSLGSLNGGFTAAGGSPTGDTAFSVDANNAANRVIDPLRQFQAQLAATETQRKMQAFQPVLGAPTGQVANSYFNAASMMQPNYGPSLGLFAQSLKSLFPEHAAGSGTGGVMGDQGAIPPGGTSNWNGSISPGVFGT